METDYPSAPAQVPQTQTPAQRRPVHAAPAAVDASLPEADWACVLTLRRGGVTDAGMYRLLRLRTLYRRDADPATDGLQHDPRALFARWLIAQGRLHEGD